MARPEKTKNGALDYEQQREENIKRNRKMIAAILLKKSQVSSLFSPPKTKRDYVKKQYCAVRQSLRCQGLPPQCPSGRFSFADAFADSGSYWPLVEATCWAGKRRKLENIVKEVDMGLDARVGLGLRKENIRKVVGGWITTVRFLPVLSRSIVISGNKEGYLGIWDADLNTENGEGGSRGVYVFYPHKSPVSGISVHHSSVRKVSPYQILSATSKHQKLLRIKATEMLIYSSCHDGDLCLMDIEKEMFDIIHSSELSIFSLSQSPHDHCSLILGKVAKVEVFDERAGKVVNEWKLHYDVANTIDFHPENSKLIATSGEKFVRIWDLRCIGKNRPKPIQEVAHNRAVHSAYFSPTGNGIVSTSIDDTVRILTGPHYKDLSIIKHTNKTGQQWLSSFRAIWGWNDSYIYIGNMQKAVDVISTEDNITTPLQSKYMTNVPCRFACHPYKEGHLACAGGGELYLWTKV